MPKGVEHKHKLMQTRQIERVQQSLMPKGVEHYGMRVIFRRVTGAAIFDAERR